MKNNECPSIDSIYSKVFWPKLNILVLWSLNYGFQSGQMSLPL